MNFLDRDSQFDEADKRWNVFLSVDDVMHAIKQKYSEIVSIFRINHMMESHGIMLDIKNIGLLKINAVKYDGNKIILGCKRV